MHALLCYLSLPKVQTQRAGSAGAKEGDASSTIGILAGVRREFSDAKPELMDLPQRDTEALRQDLENIAGLNRMFGARRAVASLFHGLARRLRRVVLVDLASGYGDHGRNVLARAGKANQAVTVIAMDFQFQTLQISRAATPKGTKMFFVQADARQLPLRNHQVDLVFCSLALHHFSDSDALVVMREMRRVGRVATACIDLVRSRVGTWCIWLLTTFIVRDPMVRHDARVSIRRAFTTTEMRRLSEGAGWLQPKCYKFPWFQQAIHGRGPQVMAAD
jgi:2-polyprenyl-3-methyl-5-hydroxy-6-metoxy-1,4-benzoquinol methylase